MEQEKAENLAREIAALLKEKEKSADDFSALCRSIEKIGERLAKIEEKLETSAIHPSSFISHTSIHPSREKFDSLEEIAGDVINSFENEKACPYEPTGKPCDHCAMCSSRGF